MDSEYMELYNNYQDWLKWQTYNRYKGLVIDAIRLDRMRKIKRLFMQK